MPSSLRSLERRRLVALAAASAPGPAIARSEQWPARSIRVLIGVPAGGAQDVLTAWFAHYAPAKTPPAVGDGTEALVRTMRDDTERWGKIMHATNFSATE